MIATTLEDAGIASPLAEQLGVYGGLVLDANRSVNLTAAREPKAFAQHILDAMTLAADIDGPLIDIGSGAGLPGIPLAIASGHAVTLIDAVKKKATFLARVLSELGLSGDAINIRAEVLGTDPAFRERFRCATARAVSTAPTVAELTVPFLDIGGHALLQRGSMDDRERRAVTDAAPMLGANLVEERRLSNERRILVLRKVAATQNRFPRRNGIPEKRPLCLT